MKRQVDQAVMMVVQEFTMGNMDMTIEPISKEDTLKYVRIMEEKKVTTFKALMTQARQGAINQQQMAMVMEMDKEKQMDELFLQFGVDTDDINRAFSAHEISKQPEFQQIMAECQAKMRQ